MSTEAIERELTELRKRVETLEAQVATKSSTSWREVVGFAKNDDLFEKAMSLGAEWRAKANLEGR